MEFSFATAGTIRFGCGAATSIASLLQGSASRIFVLTGSSPYRNKRILEILERNGLELELHSITNEPTVDSVRNAVNAAREFNAEAVVGIGGGSVLDTGKAVAAMLSNSGELLDYLELVGKGMPLINKSAPYIAVPTTAGTGAEVTKNSVIGVPQAGVKVSMRSDYMLPSWAIVDPELTYELSAEVSAYTGMDALIQCLEAFLSSQSNPLTDGIAREGLRHAAKSIKASCTPKLDREAKSDMCVASLCSGLALANAKLGAVHGFAGPLGGMIEAPHGAICSSLLLECYKANLSAMTKREPKNPALAKMDQLAIMLTGNPSATAKYAIAWLESLISDLPTTRLGKLGFTPNQIDEAADKAARSSSMKGNPIALSSHELKDILDASI